MVSKISQLKVKAKRVATKLIASRLLLPRKPKKIPPRVVTVVKKVIKVIKPRIVSIPPTFRRGQKARPQEVAKAITAQLPTARREVKPTTISAEVTKRGRVLSPRAVAGIKSDIARFKAEPFSFTGEAVGGTFRAAFLAGLFGAPSKATTLTAQEQAQSAVRIGNKLDKFSVPVPFGSGRFGLNFPGAIKQALIEEERFALTARQARDLRKQAKPQLEFLAGEGAEALAETRRQQQDLNRFIETQGSAGFSDVEIKQIQDRQAGITAGKQKIFAAAQELGITPIERGGEIKFTSPAIDTDIRKGSTKFIASLPKEGPARELVIAGRTFSAIGQGIAGGAVLRGVGFTGLVGQGFARLAPAAQKVAGLGLGAFVVGGAGLKSVSSFQEAPQGAKTAVVVSDLLETGGRLGGLIAGADPTRFSPVQVSNLKFKTIVSPKGEVQFVQGGGPGSQTFVRSLGVKVPGTTNPAFARPLITRAPVGGVTTGQLTGGKFVATGQKLFFKTSFGFPKGGVITPTGEFTPSGSFETSLALRGIKSGSLAQRQIVEGGFVFAKAVQKAKPEIFRLDPLQQTKGFQRLSIGQRELVTQRFGKLTGGRIFIKARPFGSSISNVQLAKGLGRQPKDIDVRILTGKGAKAFTKQFVRDLNAIQGGTRLKISAKNPGQVLAGKDKVFDFSGADIQPPVGEAVEAPFGIRPRPLIRIGTIRGTRLAEEAAGKLSSISSLSPKGFVPGAPKTRLKDVGDLLTFGPQLIRSLAPGKQPAALAGFVRFKAGAVAKFGPGVLSQGGQIQPVAFSFPSPSAVPSLASALPSFKPSLTGKGAKDPKFRDFPSISTSAPPPSVSASLPSGSLSISPSVSPSLSVSVSPSPSLSTSPSFPSLSASPSPSSVSVSLSPSPSVSASASSPSPSPSPSPFADVFVTPAGGLPFLFPSLSFRRAAPLKGERARAPIQFTPSITGLVSGVTLTEVPTQLPGGGFSPFQIRGRVVRKKKKKKGKAKPRAKALKRKTKKKKGGKK